VTTAAAETHHAPRARVRFRVGDLVRAHGDEYTHLFPTTPLQRRVLERLSRCRTPALGGFLSSCDVCDYRRVVYNPCRDRHCPSCEGQAASKWLAQLKEKILPGRYFHVVFTLPAELRWLAFSNAALCYGLLLRCAGETLLEVAADPKFLGAQPGITVVLHTWRRDLGLHPHAHCVVTGGGLTPSGDDWKSSWGERFLAPLRVLGARFRRRFLRRVARAHKRGLLRFGPGCAELEDPRSFAALRAEFAQKPWLVYAKATFGDLDHLLRYLARYTHRVGISDRRLLEVDEDYVTFATKNGGSVTVEVFEFLKRFLLHVLPHGFVKIRHYGLFAVASRSRLEQARALLQQALPDPARVEFEPEHDEQPATRCPACLFGELQVAEFPPIEGLPLPDP